jgi:hypothetical protein
MTLEIPSPRGPLRWFSMPKPTACQSVQKISEMECRLDRGPNVFPSRSVQAPMLQLPLLGPQASLRDRRVNSIFVIESNTFSGGKLVLKEISSSCNVEQLMPFSFPLFSLVPALRAAAVRRRF